MGKLQVASLFFAALLTVVFTQDCVSRYYTADSFVCVCNSTYCDFPGQRPYPEGLNYTRVVSSRDQYRFEEFSGVEEFTQTGSTLILVEHFLPEEQEIFGFGGSFTDSAGINIASLPQEAQNNLMRSYFAPEGIQYNMGRVPIAGSDFSTYAYSYDDVWMDVNLTYFSLTQEDYNYKIPLILEATTLSNNTLRVVGSTWSPPAWMKTNGMHNGSGILIPEMWGTYADYLLMFLDDYALNGVDIWGVTIQNEPLTGFSNHPWNTCGWTAEDARDFIRDVFGPLLASSPYSDVLIMSYDHNRDYIPSYPATTFNDSQASQYVQGTAVHWYNDHLTGPEVLDQLHEGYSDKFILYTEACTGWASPANQKVILGDWGRAQNYAFNILENMNHHVVGWIDWNMALDMGGGPNWVSNFVDSPIIVDSDSGEFLKQPMFYALGHFSKYIQRGARRIHTLVTGSPDIYAASFHNPDGEEAVVVLNTGETTESISIETHAGEYINFDMNAKSIETVIYHSSE